jgi:hypothetical protein
MDHFMLPGAREISFDLMSHKTGTEQLYSLIKKMSGRTSSSGVDSQYFSRIV